MASRNVKHARVILLLQHDEHGSEGLILNKATGCTIGNFTSKLPLFKDNIIHYGGRGGRGSKVSFSPLNVSLLQMPSSQCVSLTPPMSVSHSSECVSLTSVTVLLSADVLRILGRGLEGLQGSSRSSSTRYTAVAIWRDLKR
jgi:hypothetical protein